MIKYTIHNNANPKIMRYFHKRFKVFIISKTSVYFFVILCIVSVCRGFK